MRRSAVWFQSQGRFFGGCCFVDEALPHGNGIVSIAGAILWGVLLTIDPTPGAIGTFQSQGRFFGGCCARSIAPTPPGRFSFNRRGDSLGGAA